MSERSQIRDDTMADLRTFAEQLFAKRPDLQSVLMTVAQYWNDEADDAVHAHAIASERATPLWPHHCNAYEEDLEPIAGEYCWNCWNDMGWMPFDDNGAGILGFSPYCHEEGSQDQSNEDNYLPYAIARRTPHGIAIEIVGTVLRGDSELPSLDIRGAAAPRALDERARDLFFAACANGDDTARQVFADHLLDHGDPRGEYIALALAPALDADAIARRDALLAEHQWKWIHPLANVVVEPAVRFERGLLSHVDVFAPDQHAAASVKGALPWASVETLHYVPGSHDVLDPMMMALRDVAPVGTDGIRVLARAARPWAIESLHAVLDRGDDKVLATAKLPRLRRLTLRGRDDKGALFGAPWWDQLDKLTLIVGLDELAVYWRLIELSTRCVAFAGVGHHGRASGWEIAWNALARRIEIRLLGFAADSSRAQLRDVLDRLPAGAVHLIGGSLWQPTEDDITYLSRPDRPVSRA